MTNLLGVPNDGLNKWVKHRTLKILEESRKSGLGKIIMTETARLFAVLFLLMPWYKQEKDFRVQSDSIMKVAIRIENLFNPKADRSSQFDGVNLRGIVDEDRKPKNTFAGKRFEGAFS